MRTLLTLATAVLLAVGAPAAAMAAPVQATAGVPGSGLGIRLVDPVGHLVDATIEPGESFSGRVRISNDTWVARDIAVFTGSAGLVDGNVDADPLGETNALSSWISVDKPVLRLNSGTFEEVKFTIAVPSNAPSADLQALLWARVDSTLVGVPMKVKVGGTNGPAADFSITDLAPQRRSDGTAVVAATVTNLGGRTSDMTGTLRLAAGPGGERIDGIAANPTTLAAGETGTVLFVVPDSALLPAGPWSAKVRLKNGYFTHELEESVTFPEREVETPNPPSAGSLGSLGSLGSGS